MKSEVKPERLLEKYAALVSVQKEWRHVSALCCARKLSEEAGLSRELNDNHMGHILALFFPNNFIGRTTKKFTVQS